MSYRFISAFISIGLLLCGLDTVVYAQNTSGKPQEGYIELGLDPNAVVNIPVGSVTSIRGQEPCCQTFQSNTSIFPGGGIYGTYVLPTNNPSGIRLYGIRFMIGYDNLSSQFESEPANVFDAFDPVNGQYVNAQTIHRLDYTMGFLRTAVEGEFQIVENLFLHIGPSFELPLSGSVTETESIVSPSNAIFSDQTQERTVRNATGDLTDLSARLGLGWGIRYRLPLSKRLYFEPSATMDIGLTNIQPDWKPLIGRLGIGIGYAAIPEPPKPPDTIPPPPPPPPPIVFKADITASVHADVLPVVMPQQIVAHYVPIIPTIFFDENNSELPTRYIQADEVKESGGRYDETTVSSDPSQAHIHVLNVIGRRMKDMPSVKVVLTGTTSNDESNRPQLAAKRVESVAKYLRDVWSIDKSRITVKSRLDPAVPSNKEYAEGREENRRVEIEFNDDAVYRAIQVRKAEPLRQPEAISFNVGVANTTQPIASYALEIRGPRLLESGTPPVKWAEVSGKGNPPSIVRWDLTQADRERLLASRGVAEFQVVVYNEKGEHLENGFQPLPLRIDTTVNVAAGGQVKENTAEFTLVTFDFDRVDLTKRGREELKTIVQRVGPGSTVTIIGYTDKFGDQTHNIALAEARARKVAEAMPPGTSVQVRGATPDEAPYDNEKPEGRFLSRTVRITITNPK